NVSIHSVPLFPYTTLFRSQPDQLPKDPGLKDALYGENAPLFRKTHGKVRVTIFQGGHEIVHEAALNWLAAQRKSQPVVWDPPKTDRKSTRLNSRHLKMSYA